MDEFGLRFEKVAADVISANAREIFRAMSAPPGWIRAGTIHEDTKQVGDLVIDMMGVPVGVRVRRHEFMARFKNEITLRSAASNGGKTELDKIQDGCGHLMFYGFAAASNDPHDGFAFWRVVDLHRLRGVVRDPAWRASAQTIANRDGTAFVPICVGPRSNNSKCCILTSETSPQMALWEALG